MYHCIYQSLCLKKNETQRNEMIYFPSSSRLNDEFILHTFQQPIPLSREDSVKRSEAAAARRLFRHYKEIVHNA